MSANNPSSQLHDPDYDVAVRDPEAAARGLALVQQLLDEGEDAADRKDLKVGEEIKKELRDTLSELHPADIAYILEALPLDERLASIGCTIVMQELGFQSIEYLFHQYTLCGKRDHFDTEKYFHRYVWWGNACHALQNFDIATLLEAWGDYLVKAYNPNDCWNLYLLMQDNFSAVWNVPMSTKLTDFPL